jgi:hypothetical protein
MFTALLMQAIEWVRTAARGWTPLQLGTVAALAVLCLALATLLYAELAPASAPAMAAPPAAAGHGSPTAGRETGEASNFRLPPLAHFAAVTERPLFAPSRRPARSLDDGTAGAWSSFVLSGVILSSGMRTAIIGHGEPPKLKHLQEGQEIDGWDVVSIRPDRVLLRRGDIEHALTLVKRPADASSSPPDRAPSSIELRRPAALRAPLPNSYRP